MKKRGVLIYATLILCLCAGCGNNRQQEKQEQANSRTDEAEQLIETKVAPSIQLPTKANLFTKINGESTSAGILFDDDNTMYVAIDKELVKITPDGQVKPFCSLKDCRVVKHYIYDSPVIWDMTFDKEHNILAAAQDRIVKITPEGEVTTLLEEAFGGFLGTTGITCDDEGNFYITNGSKIEKFTPQLERSVYVDGSPQGYKGFFSLAFDPKRETLYVSDWYTKTLLAYEIDQDGTISKAPTIITHNPLNSHEWNFGSPLNIVFSESETMYVSMDGFGKVMRREPDGKVTFLQLGDQTENHIIAFGGKGFKEESLYMTTLMGKEIYEYPVGEKEHPDHMK